MATGQFREDLWKKAFLSVQEQFNIEQLMPEQEQCIRAYLEKGNVFVNLPTGFGKSVVFQCLPIVGYYFPPASNLTPSAAQTALEATNFESKQAQTGRLPSRLR